MKKRRSITELIDSLRSGAQESAKPEGPGTAALARLGAAFLGRLELPEGMSTEEAVAAILGMWENAGTARADKPEAGAADKAPEETPSEDDSDAMARIRAMLSPVQLSHSSGCQPTAAYT